MGFYAFLDRLRLPGGYAGKFFLVAFVGVHVPLICGLAWALSDEAVNWPLLGVLLVATLGGTAMTFAGLHLLLTPVRAATTALEAYATGGALPLLPTRHRDLAGRLMAQTQETLGGLDTALTAARGGQRDAAEQMQRRLRAMADVTHELRSPLNAVLGFAELLQVQSHGPLGHPRYAEFAADIHASWQHMLALVEDVQRYATATGGKAALEVQPVDLRQAAERAARLLRLEEESRGVRIGVAVPSGLTVAADARALLQMLLNLIGTAVKYSGPGATVRVTAEEGSQGVTVAVSDNGAGMTPEDLRVALEPFGRRRARRERGCAGRGSGCH